MKDITANRHKGNAQSREAFERIADKLKWGRRRVYSQIFYAGAYGMTARECAAYFGVSMNQISGRFSELKRDGLIEQIGRRDGCAVYVAK